MYLAVVACALSILLFPHGTIADCQFPDFLLLPTKDSWWSHGVKSGLQGPASLSQLRVRADLRMLMLTYPSENLLVHSISRDWTNRQAVQNRSQTSIAISIRCDMVADVISETFVAELMTPGSRSLYICMRFKRLDKGNPTEIFELFQGDGAITPHDVQGCGAAHTPFHRSIWIPNAAKYRPRTTTSGHCPLAGGFQAKNFIDISTLKPICQSPVYATIDSECIRGEGVEFHFNEPSCNPFEPTLVTKMDCFVQWLEHGNTNAILVGHRENGQFIIASLLYYEAPLPVDTLNNAYGAFTIAYLGLGVYRPFPYTLEGSAVAFPAYLYDLLGFSGGVKGKARVAAAASATSVPQGPTAKGGNENEAIVYEVKMRGAFGVCDDELEQCEKGCNAETRNRLFCRRTCPSVRKECNMEHRDSCEIGASYHGLWHLIDAEPKLRDTVSQQSSNRYLKKLIHIADRTVSFADVLGDETYYEFSCLREASETVSDWYILGGRQLRPGCHPRDVCLELYQSRPIFSNEGPNTNTLQYKISKSQRQGVDIEALCTFAKERERTHMLVKQPKRMGTPEALNKISYIPSKCELYQIRLKGTIIFHARLYSSLIAQQELSIKNNKNIYYGQPFGSDWVAYQDPLQLQNSGAQREDFSSLPEVASCPIELSDFNPELGTTGEFDGHIRFKSSCTLDLFSKITNSAHQCISVYNMDKSFKSTKKFLMLVTYSEFANSFFCWIIQESEVDKKAVFLIHLFRTPQCQYEEMALGEISVNKSAAIAIMQVVSEKASCLNCEQNTQPEPTKPPRFQKFRHFFEGVSITPKQPSKPSSTSRGPLNLSAWLVVIKCLLPSIL